MKKQNKGITLVALVITIIVLIILAGVSINAVWNGGLIQNSKDAKSAYENGTRKEQQELSSLEYMMAENMENTVASTLKVGDYVKYKYKVGEEEKTLICILISGNEKKGFQIVPVKDIPTIEIKPATLAEAQDYVDNPKPKLDEVAQQFLNTEYAVSARCIDEYALYDMDDVPSAIDDDGGFSEEVFGDLIKTSPSHSIIITMNYVNAAISSGCLVAVDFTYHPWAPWGSYTLIEGSSVNALEDVYFAPVITLKPDLKVGETVTESGITAYTLIK